MAWDVSLMPEARVLPCRRRTQIGRPVCAAGDALFPAVSELQPEHGAKVTGMILEMSEAEILHVLAKPPALRAKVGA